MCDAPASSFIDDLASIVSEPTSSPWRLNLASAKQLDHDPDDKSPAVVYPRRSVLPAGFWTRVVNPIDLPSSSSSSTQRHVNPVVPPLADAAPTLQTKENIKLDNAADGEDDDGATAILYDYPPTVLSRLWTKERPDNSEPTTPHDQNQPPSAANVVVHGWVESNGEDSGISDGDDQPISPSSAMSEGIARTETDADSAMLQFVDTNVDHKDAEIERLTKQNEFLVHLLRKVTAKVMKNKTDLAFYRKKLRDLMRPVPKPATAEIAIQTSDDEVSDDGSRESGLVGSPQIESLTWQLKVASAKIHSLSTCLDAAKARLDADSSSTSALTVKYEAEAAMWKAQLTNAQAQATAHRASLANQEALSSVLCEYVGRCGVAIEPSMDAKAAEALLQPHTVVRRTHLAAADSLYDRLTDSMARELTFLSKLDSFDPTDLSSCQNLYKQPPAPSSRRQVVRR